ncbi:MAG: N-6 DNA methylase [Thermomicrobiales bacterium]
MRELAFVRDANVRRNVDYKNLGSQELGSVYESLLELHPELNIDARTFQLSSAAGSERKTTGSYYTPDSLVSSLLDTALDPVLDEAARSDDPEPAILSLKVCDPAVGSGHFLIAAAHRIARKLAAVRSGDDEPPPGEVQHALRDVISRCLYGVDVNPMAVELCKVSLWMEAIEPGKALSFLDHHIKTGNSLLGATPRLLADGIPDDAFKPIEGDDKSYVTEWRKRNRDQRKGGQMSLFTHDMQPWERLGDWAATMRDLEQLDDGSYEAEQMKQQMYREQLDSSGYLHNQLRADAWCASFVWKKTKAWAYPITEEVYRRIERNPYTLEKAWQAEIKRLARQYRFFHWHLAFPDVFRLPGADEEPENEETGWSGGFDVVLGNPPWEHTELKEKEWFAPRDPEIANARTGAQRKRMIDALRTENQPLYDAFVDAKRQADGYSHFARNSERYPLCGTGRINTYALFAELNRSLPNTIGRVGCIIPSGIETDATTQYFFRDLMETETLASLYDFENRQGIFRRASQLQILAC